MEGNRWDRPLVCYSPRPPSEGAEEKEGRRSTRDEVYQQVLAAITEGKAPAAGLSTATVRKERGPKRERRGGEGAERRRVGGS